MLAFRGVATILPDMADDQSKRPGWTAALDRPELAHIWTALHTWWRFQTRNVDQVAVIEKIRAECDWSARYGFMICMSAGIAILGLILSSPAVVIGAMLLSPLMGPILGIGFALATGDAVWIKESTRALVFGALLAISFCALIVLLSPLQTVTSEIAARTRPNLFDLLVALFSALAGAYAMIRGRGETIVGVAIATALMPPLAVVGFGLATWNWTVFGGAFALFITNLVTIALSAALMARIYRFRANLSAKQTYYQTFGIVIAFIALAIPLGISLRQIAWETRASNAISGAIRDQFDRSARLSQIDPDFAADPINVTATVFTPAIQPDAEAMAERVLARELGRKINVSIRQFRVGTGSGDAETALLASARNDERERLNQARQAIATQLAMVAGTESDDVVVDPAKRVATVRAARLPDAGLAAYQALEQRVAATMPGWDIRMVPPASALPDVAATLAATPADAQDEGKSAATLAAAPPVKLAVWAAHRIGTPIGVSGPPDAARRVVDALVAQGVEASVTNDDSRSGAVRLRWLAPDEGQTGRE